MEELVSKILLVVALIAVSMSLFAQAQVTPYGSARVGYWFNMYDEDHPLGKRVTNDFMLQVNSRFGVDFRNEGLTGKAEFGVGANNSISLRLLWARQQFDGWSLLVGQDNDGTSIYANQAWGHDNSLIGYGVVDGSRNPMIRFAMDNGFYIAAMPAKTSNDPANNTAGIDAILPRLNIGCNLRLNDGNISLQPTFVFQMYSYNDDFGAGIDGTVISYLLGATADFRFDAMTLRTHFNFGSNTGNMGYRFGSGHGSDRDVNPNRATWTADNKTEDATTLGGFLMLGYDMTSTLNFNLGFGFANTSHKDFDNDSTKMGLYLQSTIRANRLRIVPELGMMMEGDSVMDNADSRVALGNNIYFGTQLRLDF